MQLQDIRLRIEPATSVSLGQLSNPLNYSTEPVAVSFGTLGRYYCIYMYRCNVTEVLYKGTGI